MFFGVGSPEIEAVRDEYCHVGCGNCAYFNFGCDPGVESTCKRIDHKKIRFAVPWFKSYDCGQYTAHMCAEFQPDSSCKWLAAHWPGTDAYVGEIPDDAMMWMTFGGNTKVRWAIKTKEFYEGSFQNPDGTVRCWRKMYYKKTKESPFGYKLIQEKFVSPRNVDADAAAAADDF